MFIKQCMKRTKEFIHIGIILFFAIAVYAEEEQVFSWQDCVRAAVSNNPMLVSANEEVRQTEADKKIVQSTGMPRIIADLAGSKSERAGSETQTESYSLGISGRQLLYDGSKTSKAVKEAEENINASVYSYTVVSSDVRLALRTAFVELMHTQELILLTENIALRRRQNLKLVNLRYEAGREHKGSLLTSEADLARAEFEVAQAKRAIPVKQWQLYKELGVDKIRPLRVKKEFSIQGDYSARPDIEYIADTTPFLNELMARKEAARYNLQSAKADFYPKVYLNGSIGTASSDFPPDQGEWSAGLSLSLPIFEGGSRIAEVSGAESRLQKAEADERSGKYSVLVSLENAWKDLRDSITNVSVQKKFQDAAEERAMIASAQYESGLTSFDDWVIIENSLVIARKTHLRARADMLLAEANWIQAIGGTLEYDEE
jgi:outer membrane protein TolC